jgi:hypothetical protein
VVRNFIPLALDTYFRGDSQESEFCKGVGAGGNHCVAVTAGGRRLGGKEHLKLRERELGPALEEYRKLPEEERKPKLPDAKEAQPPRRPVPPPPGNGLIVRGYCTYLKREADGSIVRSPQFYYRQNPDRWPVETQSDHLWLREREWKGLVPADPKAGDRIEVAAPLRKRFYGSMGIDYMEGSVNSLAPRETSMTLTVEKANGERIHLRLDGAARLGREFVAVGSKEKDSRGSEIRVLGFLEVDRKTGAFDRFDVVGVGRAWGNKMEYVGREVKLDDEPWLYGIACELVRTRTPLDLIPPYNLLHYGGSIRPYFGEE